MPKKVIVVEGPSVFSCLRGALTQEQRLAMRDMLCAQVSVCGGPVVKKSSR